MTGTILRDDGGPLGGARVAALERSDANQCAGSHASGVTDSLGRFRIDAARERRRILVVTMMENFGRFAYSLCVQPPDTAAPRALALVTENIGYVTGDSVACLVWGPRGAQRLTCDTMDTERAPHIRTGDSWTDGSEGGIYRLIVMPVSVGRRSECHAFVQWVALTPNGRPGVARATVELPAP